MANILENQTIDLTRLRTRKGTTENYTFTYSSKELCPPQLLLQHLIRAHSIFLLFHDISLDSLYERVGRDKFCALLERFWEKFAWKWELFLKGNPIVDIFNGLKLSAGGELGVGVGEEDWGSGERAVLEDFVTRTDGLVDLVVSKFDEVSTGKWLGSRAYPQSWDGVIFSGVGGTISRRSLVTISQWMEWIFRFGDRAYGVGEDPNSTATRRRKRNHHYHHRHHKRKRATGGLGHQDRPFSPGIPRPLVIGEPAGGTDTGERNEPNESQTQTQTQTQAQGKEGTGGTWGLKDGTETVLKYLTLGYGQPWNLLTPKQGQHNSQDQEQGGDGAIPKEDKDKGQDTNAAKKNGNEEAIITDADAGGKNNSNDDDNDDDEAGTETETDTETGIGNFIIGLHDNNNNMESEDEHDSDNSIVVNDQDGRNVRIGIRTVNVQLTGSGSDTGK